MWRHRFCPGSKLPAALAVRYLVAATLIDPGFDLSDPKLRFYYLGAGFDELTEDDLKHCLEFAGSIQDKLWHYLKGRLKGELLELLNSGTLPHKELAKLEKLCPSFSAAKALQDTLGTGASAPSSNLERGRAAVLCLAFIILKRTQEIAEQNGIKLSLAEIIKALRQCEVIPVSNGVSPYLTFMRYWPGNDEPDPTLSNCIAQGLGYKLVPTSTGQSALGRLLKTSFTDADWILGPRYVQRLKAGIPAPIGADLSEQG